MLNEKQQQAKNLYFQTDLTKTQIAELLSISRRSLHYWIRENNWARLKRSATHLPAMLAENCYLIIAKFTDTLLSEMRIKRPVTFQEAETLHKLALTVRKLKNHSTLNESMEMFAHFMERVNNSSPQLADQLAPFVSDYIEERAAVNPASFMPPRLNKQGFIPVEEEDNIELQKDIADTMAWQVESGEIGIIDIEAFRNKNKEAESPSDTSSQSHPTTPLSSESTNTAADSVTTVTEPHELCNSSHSEPVTSDSLRGEPAGTFSSGRVLRDSRRGDTVRPGSSETHDFVKDGLDGFTSIEAYGYLSDTEKARRKSLIQKADEYTENRTSVKAD